MSSLITSASQNYWLGHSGMPSTLGKYYQVLGKVNGSSLIQASETRKQSRPRTLLPTSLDTALTTSLLWAQAQGTIDKIGGRSWNCWAPGRGLTNQAPGLATFQDLQVKTNNIVKKKKKKINIKPVTVRSCQLQRGTYQEHCQWLNHKGICHLPLWRLLL